MKYRVWMTIRGSVVKPSYDGYVDDEGDAFDAAVAQARRIAHWDSPPQDFLLDRLD